MPNLRRLLLISYHFPPSSEVAGKPTARLVRHLPKFGWEPVVLTIPPASVYSPLDTRAYTDVLATTRVELVPPWPYLTDVVVSARAVAKRVFRFGRKQSTAEVTTSATSPPLSPTRQRLSEMIWRYAKFPDYQSGWVLPALRRARQLLREEHFDAIMSVAPPQSAHLAGLHLRRHTSIPWVAQLHDPWVGNPYSSEDRFQRWMCRRLERKVVQSADLVLLASDEAVATYTQRYQDLPARRFSVLYNGYDPLDFPVVEPTVNAGPLRFVYTGSLYSGRNPFPFLRSVAELIANRAVNLDQIRIEFVGDCVSADGKPLARTAAEMGLAGVVTVVPPVSYPEALNRMRSADVLLMFAQGQPEQIPAKLYEYLHMGRFILAFTDGATARVIRDTGAGLVVEPGATPTAALAAIVQMHQEGKLPDPQKGSAKLVRYQALPLAESLANHLERLTACVRRTSERTP